MNINLSDLKNRVAKPVNFIYYIDGSLWYRCEKDGYIFPVPIEDTRNTDGNQPVFNATDKGIYFMRWIRKNMEKEMEIIK